MFLKEEIMLLDEWEMSERDKQARNTHLQK